MQEECKDPHVIDEDDLKDDNNDVNIKCKLIHQCIKYMAAKVHLARPWLFRIITKTKSINYCLIIHCFEENKDKHTVTRLLLEIMH